MSHTIEDLARALLLAISDLSDVYRIVMQQEAPAQRLKVLGDRTKEFADATRAVERAARALWTMRINFPHVDCPTLRAIGEDAFSTLAGEREWMKPLAMEVVELAKAAKRPEADHPMKAAEVATKLEIGIAQVYKLLKSGAIATVPGTKLATTAGVEAYRARVQPQKKRNTPKSKARTRNRAFLASLK